MPAPAVVARRPATAAIFSSCALLGHSTSSRLDMAVKRMDNVGIVVDDLGPTIDFFRELGLELEGRATIEGEWAGRVTGLGDQRVLP